jgi:hypothetical protein
MRRNAEVAAAAWRGFRYRYGIGAPVVSEGLALARRFLRFNRRARIPLKAWKQRLRACRKCDLYDPKHKTCGDNTGVIQIVDGGSLFPNCCSCKVGVKASDPEAECTMVAFKMPSLWKVSSLRISLDGERAATNDELKSRL